MATRKLEVVITGDASSLEKSLNKVGTQSSGLASKFKKFAVVGGVVGGAMAGVAVGLGKTVQAAQESEKAQARLNQALQGAGISQDKYGASIQANIEKTSRLAALDDEDLSDSFAKLVRATGDVTRATEGMNLAADIARARNISLEAATKMVERAQIGNAAAFSRVGIAIVKSSEHLKAAKSEIDSWRDSSGKLTEAEEQKAKALMDTARTLDKQATAAKAFDEAQKRFAGGAKEYGDTSAAAQERISVALENLQEIIGAKVLPVVAKLSEKLLAFVNWSIENWPRFRASVDDAMAKARAAFEAVRPVVEAFQKVIEGLVTMVVAIFRGDWSKAWEGFKQVVAGALSAVFELIQLQFTVFKKVATELGEKIIEGVKAGLTGIGMAAWNLITNINDRISEADATIKGWGASVGNNIKNAVVDALAGIGTAAWNIINKIGSVLDDVRGQIIGWGKELARRVVSGVVDGLEGLGQAIWKSIKDAWDWAMEKAKSLPGIGRLIGDARDPNYNPFIVPPTGVMEPVTGAVNLMGARPELMPFAQAAAGYGLSVTSGLRPGAITANGTPSDHGIGKALDVAGSAAGMAGFFRSLIGNAAVKQAFYDPLGSIFGGRQSPYVEGGHNDHVHVATYDRGGVLRPGWTMAYNGTGRNEYVSRGRGGIVININAPQVNPRETARQIRDELRALDRIETGGSRPALT